MIEQADGQMSLFDLDTWSGKTSPAHSQATEEKISDASLRKQPESSIVTPMFLDLRGGIGWSNSGAIVGHGWSIAWRVHDAQFWGVPQRRKRIALVADFGGTTAPEILFERESLFGDSSESRETWQGAAGRVTERVGGTISFQERAGCEGGQGHPHPARTNRCIVNAQ